MRTTKTAAKYYQQYMTVTQRALPGIKTAMIRDDFR